MRFLIGLVALFVAAPALAQTVVSVSKAPAAQSVSPETWAALDTSARRLVYSIRRASPKAMANIAQRLRGVRADLEAVAGGSTDPATRAEAAGFAKDVGRAIELLQVDGDRKARARGIARAAKVLKAARAVAKARRTPLQGPAGPGSEAAGPPKSAPPAPAAAADDDY